MVLVVGGGRQSRRPAVRSGPATVEAAGGSGLAVWRHVGSERENRGGGVRALGSTVAAMASIQGSAGEEKHNARWGGAGETAGGGKGWGCRPVRQRRGIGVGGLWVFARSREGEKIESWFYVSLLCI